MKFLVLFFSLIFSSLSYSTELDQARTIVHLLDYISTDYAGAVQNHKVINKAEHEEHLELIASAFEISNKNETYKTESIPEDLVKLKKLISNLSDQEDVGKTAAGIKAKVISISKLPVAPNVWPSLKMGQKVFEQNCVSCHGALGQGDGPAAKNLTPPPANFQNAEVSDQLSPFKIFNTAKLGLTGTAMPAFPNLSEQDLWAVSFYISSLQFNDSKIEANDSIPLTEVATFSNQELGKKYPSLTVASIRKQSVDDNPQSYSQKAKDLLRETLKEYKNQNYTLAKSTALAAYLEGIEPIEPRIKAKDTDLLARIESAMMAVRNAASKADQTYLVEENVNKAIAVITDVEQLITAEHMSPSVTFVVSSAILLREAFEAVLVIIALLGVLRATNNKKAARYIHLGWGSATLLGIVLWFFSGWLIHLSGANRELLEGSVSLLAVFILLYMGFWLHSVTEISRWNSFIKEKVNAALSKGSLIGLAFISFTAVAREAIEVVLFLRTIWIESASTQSGQQAMIAGVAVAFVGVFVMSWALVKFSARIPIKKLFNISSLVMGTLACILIGKSLHSIQEAGKISITSLPINIRIDLLGLYPTFETFLAQVFIIALTYWLWNLGKKPSLTTAR